MNNRIFNGHSANPKPIARPSPRLRDHGQSDDDLTLEVRSLLIRQAYRSPAKRFGDALLTRVQQGPDFPGAFRRLTRPYAEREIDLIDVDFRLCGPEKRYYNAQFVAQAPPGILCEFAADTSRTPLDCEVVARSEAIQLFTIEHPNVANVHGVLFNETGLIDAIATMASEVAEDEEAVARDGVEVLPTGSLIRLKARLMQLSVRTVNDANLPFGGVPGLVVDASIAAPDESTLRGVVRKCLDFFEAHGVLRHLQQQELPEPATFWQSKATYRGSGASVPIQFLAVAE